jgi:hypothetical protein
VRSTPYQQLGARVTHAGDVNNQTNADIQSTLVCPTGKKAAPGGDEVVIENQTRLEYREESPGRSSGGSTRGRLSGSYSTYSSQDVEVEAETETRSRGRLVCIPIIDLTPARP